MVESSWNFVAQYGGDTGEETVAFAIQQVNYSNHPGAGNRFYRHDESGGGSIL